jgi:hypothetical protein
MVGAVTAVAAPWLLRCVGLCITIYTRRSHRPPPTHTHTHTHRTVTNFRRYANGTYAAFETLTRRPSGSILKHSPTAGGFVVAAEGIHMANGITRSPEGGTELYVVATTDPALLHYHIQPGRDRLRLVERIPLPFAGDNVCVDAAGAAAGEETIYVAGHPKPMHWVTHAAPDSTSLAPSAVLKIQRNHGQDLFFGKRWNITTLLSDDGTLLPGSTVFAHDSAASPLSLVSGLFTEGILRCVGLA